MYTVRIRAWALKQRTDNHFLCWNKEGEKKGEVIDAGTPPTDPLYDTSHLDESTKKGKEKKSEVDSANASGRVSENKKRTKLFSRQVGGNNGVGPFAPTPLFHIFY